MTQWTIDTLRNLDRRYAEEGVQPHQRPFRAATNILGDQFSMGVGGNPEVQRIMRAYEAMLPEANATWPGMGIGLAVVVDQVRRVTVPVMFGSVRVEVWRGLGFASDREWWAWCREERDLAAQTSFAFADLFDLTYGLYEMGGTNSRDKQLWRMATSNLSDCANALPVTFTVDSIIQPICMTAELSLKAAIVRNGADPDSFRRRGGEGHDLMKLAERLARETPHRDDALVAEVAAAMPPYVDSRYAPAGFTRLKVTRLALGAQFVAASTARRYSSRNLAAEMERGNWPGPRKACFA